MWPAPQIRPAVDAAFGGRHTEASIADDGAVSATDVCGAERLALLLIRETVARKTSGFATSATGSQSIEGDIAIRTAQSDMASEILVAVVSCWSGGDVLQHASETSSSRRSLGFEFSFSRLGDQCNTLGGGNTNP